MRMTAGNEMDNIAYTDEISLEDYVSLREAVSFKALTKRQAEAAIANHSFLIAAKDGGKTVGMTRLVSDGAYIATITDVIVLPEYQGKGIGGAMIEKTLEYIKSVARDGESFLVLLLAAKGKEGFYEKFGFVRRPDEQYGAGMSQWLC